jgi:hypothetical protein
MKLVSTHVSHVTSSGLEAVIISLFFLMKMATDIGQILSVVVLLLKTGPY